MRLFCKLYLAFSLIYMLLHIIIIKLYPYSTRFSSSYTLTKSEFFLCNFGMIFFLQLKPQ